MLIGIFAAWLTALGRRIAGPPARTLVPARIRRRDRRTRR